MTERPYGINGYRSRDGRIELTEYFWSQVDKASSSNGCWLHSAAMCKGYPTVRIDYKIYKAHRAVWISLHGPTPPRMMICHKCDEPRCVNPDHLFAGTALDNFRDMQAKGRSRLGMNTRSVPLPLVAAVMMTASASPHLTRQQVADLFHLRYRLVHHIMSGSGWKHVAACL